MKTQNHLLSLACVLVLFSCTGKRDVSYRMDYTVSLDTADHYLLVNLDLERASGGGSVMLNLPRWTPGYYEMLDFPKHLCDFDAADVAGMRWLGKRSE